MSKYLDMTGLTYLVSKLKALINTKANASHTHAYLSGLSVSGKTITYTKGDNTTGTITTQDNDTTYSAGTGISLSGTTFSNSGVRSIASGSTNGTISVNTNGTSAEVAIKGLGTAAYTASTAYAAASHGTHVSYGTSSSALGTSSAGSATTVSRSDHVHALPALTSCTGTLTVAKGGTGATTATAALTNLGITYGTSALTPGTSTLATGKFYFQYE